MVDYKNAVLKKSFSMITAQANELVAFKSFEEFAAEFDDEVIYEGDHEYLLVRIRDTGKYEPGNVAMIRCWSRPAEEAAA